MTTRSGTPDPQQHVSVEGLPGAPPVQVQGNVAHDAVESGNPIPISGFATEDFSANPDVAVGDRVRFAGTRKGALFIAFGIPISDGITASYRSVISEADGEGILAVGLYTNAPDGSADRNLSLGNTAGAGFGVLAAAPWIPGASDVKSQAVVVGATSVNRATVITPSSGKKIRVLSVKLASNSATDPDKVGVYFGTGAAYLTNPTTSIGEYHPGTDGSDGQEWPDGGGPIGAADAVLSWITETETEVGLDITVQYREE